MMRSVEWRVLLVGMAAALYVSQAAAAPPEKSAQCVACHGAEGLSQIPNAPNLAGQPEMYLTSSMEAYRDGRRTDEMMSVIAKTLTDADIAELAAWFASIEVTVKVPE